MQFDIIFYIILYVNIFYILYPLSMNKETLLHVIKTKAKTVCQRYLPDREDYYLQKCNEIDRQPIVEYIIWNFDGENQNRLKKLLTPEERKQVKQHFYKELQ